MIMSLQQQRGFSWLRTVSAFISSTFTCRSLNVCWNEHAGLIQLWIFVRWPLKYIKGKQKQWRLFQQHSMQFHLHQNEDRIKDQKIKPNLFCLLQDDHNCGWEVFCIDLWNLWDASSKINIETYSKVILLWSLEMWILNYLYEQDS